MANKTPEFVTIRQAAARGIISEHALRLLIKQGLIPYISVGNRFLIHYPLLLQKLDELAMEQRKVSIDKSC